MINLILEEEFVSLLLLKVYIKDKVTLCNKLNLSLVWYPPSGLIISQRYLALEKHKITYYSYNKGVTLVLKLPTVDINAKKQLQSFKPNYIHSFDSSLVVKTINELSIPCLTIHDCFGSSPNNKSEVRRAVIMNFVNMYIDQDYLSKLHIQNINNKRANNITVSKGHKANKYYIPDYELELPIPPKIKKGLGIRKILSKILNSYLIR